MVSSRALFARCIDASRLGRRTRVASAGILAVLNAYIEPVGFCGCLSCGQSHRLRRQARCGARRTSRYAIHMVEQISPALLSLARSFSQTLLPPVTPYPLFVLLAKLANDLCKDTAYHRISSLAPHVMLICMSRHMSWNPRSATMFRTTAQTQEAANDFSARAGDARRGQAMLAHHGSRCPTGKTRDMRVKNRPPKYSD